MLIDTHCHLDKLDLTPYDDNLDALINSAYEAGVRQILSISVDLQEIEPILNYTKRDGVFASVGVHPLYESGLLTNDSSLIELADHSKVVAIGETGLDYFYEKSAELHEKQKVSFAVHLQTSAKLTLPTIIHTRDARRDTIDLIKQYGDINIGGVLHCFTESYDMAVAALDENYLISISGIATFKTAQELRDVVKKLPIESIIVETDSPYLAPVPYRGKKNEPKYVSAVAQLVADIKGMRYEAVLEQTAHNFHTKFNKVEQKNQLNLV